MKNLFQKKYIFCFFLLFLFSCSKGIEEKEPNNTFLEAQLVSLPFTIQGKMNHGLDEDFYAFEVSIAQIYSFEVKSLKGFDLMMQILDSQGKVLKTADDYFKNFGESIPNIYLKPGKYFLKIATGINDYKIGRPVVVSSNHYTLKGGPFSNFCDRPVIYPEHEPNDNFEMAQEIFKGQKIEGYFYPFLNYQSQNPVLEKVLEAIKEKTYKDFFGRDLDLYYFSIQEKGEFLLKIELGACQDFDSILSVVSENYLNYLSLSPEAQSQVLPENRGEFFIIDSNGFDKGEGLANYKIKGNQKYYILLTAINRLNYESLENILQNPYTLNFEISPVTADLEAEPNDSFTTAQKIETNVLKGFLNPLDDKDFYVLENSLDSFYKLDFREDNINPHITRFSKLAKLTLTPPINLDLALEIYDDKYQLLKTIDNQGKGEIEVIPNLLLELNQRIFLVVRGGKTNDEDNYHEPYELKIYFNDTETQKIEAEINDEAFKNQRENTFTDSILGYINTQGDIDNYYLLVENRGRVQFLLKGLPHASFLLELYDANGFFVKKAVGKLGENVVLDYFAPKREVFRIKVLVIEKDFFNTQDPYELSFSVSN